MGFDIKKWRVLTHNGSFKYSKSFKPNSTNVMKATGRSVRSKFFDRVTYAAMAIAVITLLVVIISFL